MEQLAILFTDILSTNKAIDCLWVIANVGENIMKDEKGLDRLVDKVNPISCEVTKDGKAPLEATKAMLNCFSKRRQSHIESLLPLPFSLIICDICVGKRTD
jgi:hypothetical protein